MRCEANRAARSRGDDTRVYHEVVTGFWRLVETPTGSATVGVIDWLR